MLAVQDVGNVKSAGAVAEGEVDQCGVGVEAVGLRQSGSSVRCGAHLKALRGQTQLEQGGCERLVLNNEDASRGAEHGTSVDAVPSALTAVMEIRRRMGSHDRECLCGISIACCRVAVEPLLNCGASADGGRGSAGHRAFRQVMPSGMGAAT